MTYKYTVFGIFAAVFLSSGARGETPAEIGKRLEARGNSEFVGSAKLRDAFFIFLHDKKHHVPGVSGALICFKLETNRVLCSHFPDGKEFQSAN